MRLSQNRLSISPPSAARLVGGVALLTVLSAVGAACLNYSRLEVVEGYLQAQGGELRVTAPVRGVVTYSVAPGADVASGALLATVRAPEVLTTGQSPASAAQQLLDTKTASLRIEQLAGSAGLDAKLQALQSERALAATALAQAEAEVTTRRQVLKLEQTKYARQKEMLAQGFISQAGLEQAQAEVLTKEAELTAAQGSLSRAKTQAATYNAEEAAARAQATSTQAQLTRTLQDIRQQSADAQRQGSSRISATQSSSVVTLATSSGDTVEAGQLLLKMVPRAAATEAQLLLPSTASSRIKVGQHVALQMDAFPFQAYGVVDAEISRVDTSPLLVDDTPLRSAGAQPGTLVVKATAKLTAAPKEMGGLPGLHNGMRFKASVEVERKSFLAWMTWPLLKHFVRGG